MFVKSPMFVYLKNNIIYKALQTFLVASWNWSQSRTHKQKYIKNNKLLDTISYVTHLQTSRHAWRECAWLWWVGRRQSLGNCWSLHRRWPLDCGPETRTGPVQGVALTLPHYAVLPTLTVFNWHHVTCCLAMTPSCDKKWVLCGLSYFQFEIDQSSVPLPILVISPDGCSNWQRKGLTCHL